MGDFTVLGWATTGLYFVAAYLSYQSYRHYYRLPFTPDTHTHRRGWALHLLFMSALGINKQLDLQTLIIRGGRDLVVALRLFQYHRTVQVAVFVGAAVFVFGSIFFSLPIFLRAKPPLRVGFWGLGVVAAYVMCRVALFQKISSKVGTELIHYVEPIGILMICYGAWLERVTAKSTQGRR